MFTPEEAKVLTYLGNHALAASEDVFRSCLPSTPLAWRARLIADLEWLGYVTVYYGGDGEPIALQLTRKGREYVVQKGGVPGAARAGGLSMGPA
jgi:hypothetical protein